MNERSVETHSLLAEQAAIRAKCFHPSGAFVEFPIEDVESSIPARFEKIVRMFANEIAVNTEEQTFTYEQLNNEANRIAHLLLATRGNISEPVALLLDPGISLVASMLGVLKSGKFFVILDSSLPVARLTAIMEYAQTEIVIADAHNTEIAAKLKTEHCSAIQYDEVPADSFTRNLDLAVSAGDCCYVAYTSGSTGQPKGVCQNHRNLLHNIRLRNQETRISHFDRVSLLTAGTANSVHDILFPLLNGAALFPFNVRREGVDRLVSWLNDEKITLCWLSSPVFRNLCDSLNGKGEFRSLRLVRLRSDSVYESDINRFRELFPPTCLLLIGLASSETGIIRALYVRPTRDIAYAGALAGYPVEDKEILLLGEQGQELGCDVIGEIVVRSRYLSPGYWRQPELTEAKFRPDPKDADKRLYFTGDLGLMRSDGCLFHKGRKDFRIKIHGYGVDIVEVEETLRTHPDIVDVVVVARGDGTSERRLLAYMTTRSPVGPSVTELRRFMQKRLSDYMIPSSVALLDALPLTANGKIDRGALLDPGNARPNLNVPFTPPMTTTEKQLTSIWTEVLLVEQVGIHDSFFDLGGHSLAASRVISRVIQTFQLDIPLKALFDTPTIAEMAEVVAQYQGKQINHEELNRLLTEVETLTEEAAQILLAQKDNG